MPDYAIKALMTMHFNCPARIRHMFTSASWKTALKRTCMQYSRLNQDVQLPIPCDCCIQHYVKNNVHVLSLNCIAQHPVDCLCITWQVKHVMIVIMLRINPAQMSRCYQASQMANESYSNQVIT